MTLGYRRSRMKFCEKWGCVAVATNHSISVLLRLTICVQEVLVEFLPLRDSGSRKNSASNFISNYYKA